ncbi:MAG: hypothetical protein HOW73_40180 [Polyangiaceae bacterium]|nr:hypothetical protein [Polyangiaceae bacterium]
MPRSLLATLLKVAAALVAAGGVYNAAVQSAEVSDAVGKPGGVPHGGLLGVGLQLLIVLLVSAGILWTANRVGDPGRTKERGELNRELARVVEKEANVVAGTQQGNSDLYRGLSTAELLDCYNQLDRERHPEQLVQIVAAMRDRARASSDH